MSKILLLKSISLFFIFFVYGCKNSDAKRSKFIYENGTQKVQLKILNGNDYLEYDTPTETNFEFTNNNPFYFTVLGTGINILELKPGILKTEINIPNNSLETDTLNIKIKFGKEPKEKCEFNIPVKRIKDKFKR